jgi:hypothetical protein
MTKFLMALLLAATVPAFGQTFKLESILNPSAEGSIQPNWSVTPDGNPLLSWVEKSKDGSYALKFAIRTGSAWSEPRTITTGRHFFRHPAELPEVISLSQRSLLAHWVEMPNESSEAEFVYLSASRDGAKWTAPVMANKDHGNVLHGLASMAGTGSNEASLFWLQAPPEEGGKTSLMRTVVDADGHVVKEERLDSDVCECCPTTVVKTKRGLLVAYRSHTSQDIRDIAILRFEDGRWLPSKRVYADNWKINACPVNAASAAANGDEVAVAWYTGAPNAPRVELAFSADSGATFSKPVTVSTGFAYGYASVVLDGTGSALISWLEKGGDSARLLVRPVARGGALGPVTQIAQAGKQGLGYPRLVQTRRQVWITFGSAAKGQRVQTGLLTSSGNPNTKPSPKP